MNQTINIVRCRQPDEFDDTLEIRGLAEHLPYVADTFAATSRRSVLPQPDMGTGA